MSDLKERMAKVISEREERAAAKQAADKAAAAETAKAVDAFFRVTAADAFLELQQAFEANGRKVEMKNTTTDASIAVSHAGGREIQVDLRAVGSSITTQVWAAYSSAPGQSFSAVATTKDQLVEFVVRQWEATMKGSGR